MTTKKVMKSIVKNIGIKLDEEFFITKDSEFDFGTYCNYTYKITEYGIFYFDYIWKPLNDSKAYNFILTQPDKIIKEPKLSINKSE